MVTMFFLFCFALDLLKVKSSFNTLHSRHYFLCPLLLHALLHFIHEPPSLLLLQTSRLLQSASLSLLLPRSSSLNHLSLASLGFISTNFEHCLGLRCPHHWSCPCCSLPEEKLNSLMSATSSSFSCLLLRYVSLNFAHIAVSSRSDTL